VTAKLQYCQSANHQADGDTSCSSICNRQDNTEWDPYRSDCSGLVSWSWGLPAPGRTTGEFAPADTTVSHTIPGSELSEGDAVNIPGDHIILFKAWITQGSRATFIEEPGCSSSTPYAHEFDSDITISGTSVTIAYEGRTFTAIRYDGLQPGGSSGSGSGSGASGSGASGSGSAGGGGAACSTDGDCNLGSDGSGQICLGGACVAGCNADWECPGNTTCQQGQCR
jgi:hypothetical protein